MLTGPPRKTPAVPRQSRRGKTVIKIIDRHVAILALSFPVLIKALEEMFKKGGEAPLRTIHELKSTERSEGTLLLMPAWDSSGYLGVKTVTIFPDNALHGEPGLHSVYTLFDGQTGKPLALIEADPITARRTAAASALAASYLARKDASRLLVVGAGAVASMLADAYSAVRDLTEVCVWNRNKVNAQTLVDSLQAQGYRARLSEDLEEDVKKADIISCATFSANPLIFREWLQPGTHLDLIGGFKPTMREADDACFNDTSVFIDTEEALLKAGDLLSPINNGVFDASTVKANLKQLCQRNHSGRVNDDEITVFKAVGNAVEDLVAARLIYEAEMVSS